MPQIIVNNLLINYTRQGSGEVVLLLHGWGDSTAGLKNIIEELSVKYDVIAPDLPGFGGSETPSDQPWGLQNYAQILQDFLAKIHVEGIYGIVGHSNGGAIAIWSVANGVLKSQKLVLLAASGVRVASKKPIHKKLIFSAAKTASKVLPSTTQDKIRTSVYAKSGSDILVAPHLEPTFRQIVAQDIQEDSKKVNIPTLLIYGQNDTATPISYGKIFTDNIAGSKLVIVQDAGHFLHLDQPALVINEIKAFLANHE